MNFIDRAVAYVNPAAAVRRVDARAALAAAGARQSRVQLVAGESPEAQAMGAAIERGRELNERLYNIALSDPNLDPRSYMNGNATEDVMSAIDTARRLVRDRMMNDPAAIRAREVLVDAIHGEGIQPRCDSRNPDPRVKDQIDGRTMERYYEHFESTDCDVNGVYDIHGLTIAAESTKACDGEVLWIDVWNSRTEVERKGLKHPLQFDVRECDWLAYWVRSYEDRGVTYPVVGGVEIDPRSKRRRAYHLATQDPSKGISETIRIDARYVVHDADLQRLQQIRGWSVFAPVVPTFHDMDDLSDAALKRAKVDAAMGVILEVPGGTPLEDSTIGTPGGDPTFRYAYPNMMDNGLPANGDGLPVTAGGAPLSFVQSGMVSRVRAGSKPHVIQPQASSVYQPAYENAMRRVAMAVSQTYEAISGDYSKVSYISGRLAKGPVNRAMQRRQWQWIIRRGRKLWRDFITGCYTMEAWGYEGYPTYEDLTWTEVNWVLPVPDSADPKLEAEVEAMQLKSGKLVHGDMIRRSGGDPSQHYRAIRQSIDQGAAVGIHVPDFMFGVQQGKATTGAQDEQDVDPDVDPNDPDGATQDEGNDDGSEA